MTPTLSVSNYQIWRKHSGRTVGLPQMTSARRYDVKIC
jgi:hypothetical protein